MEIPEDIPEIDVAGAAEHLAGESALFIDIRDPGSYSQSHIPGALQLDDTSVQSFLSETAKDRRIIVYCYHGNSSLGGAAFFLSNGFQEVYSMSGGFEAWRGRHPEESAAQ